MPLGLIGSEARKLKQRAAQQKQVAPQAQVAAPVAPVIPMADEPRGILEPRPFRAMGGMSAENSPGQTIIDRARNRGQSEVPTVAKEASKLGAFMRGPGGLPAPVAGPVNDNGYSPANRKLDGMQTFGRVLSALGGDLEGFDKITASRWDKQDADYKRQQIFDTLGLSPQDRARAEADPEGFFRSLNEIQTANMKPQTDSFYDPREGAWNRKPLGPMAVADGTDIFDPETQKRLYSNNAVKAPEPFTLNPGEVRFDANAKRIASVAPKPEPGTGPLDPNDPEKIRLEREFSKDWKTVQSDYDGIDRQYNNISAMVRQARSDPKAASAADLALVVGFTKLQDPGTVAMPGEVQLTQQTVGVVQQANNLLNTWENGKTVLPDDVRKNILAASTELHRVYQDAYQKRGSEYATTAQSYGFDPKRTLIGYQPKAPEQPKPNFLDTASQFVGNMFGGFGGQQRPGAPQPIDLSRLTPQQLEQLEQQLSQGGGR